MPSFTEIMDFYPANKFAYRQLFKRIKNGNIVPFIGAGLSACCYPSWSELLEGMLSSVSNDVAKKAKNQIDAYDYFSAADTLCDAMTPLLFFSIVRDTFDETIITEETIKDQTVYLLPQFPFQTYITTNFDRVLESAFSYNHKPFESGFPYDTFKLSTFMKSSMSSPMILKIHGDIRSNSEDLILTGRSYQNHYADGTCLKEQLSRWAESKNLLFLGASLHKDKTLDIISSRMQQGMINHAIIGVSPDEIPTTIRRIQPINVMPIFYDCKDHGSLTVIIKKLLEDLNK